MLKIDGKLIILSLFSVAIIVFFVLLQFTVPQDYNIFLVLGLAVLAMLLSLWLYLLFKNVNDWRIICLKFPSTGFFEFGLLFLMLVTLAVPPNIQPIFPWLGISPFLYFRGFIWLLGVSLLPGIYILRLVGVNKFLSSPIIFVLGASLSIIIVGLASFIIYSAQASFELLPWFILVFLVILSSIFWLKNKTKLLSRKTIKLSAWDLVLILCIITGVFIAFAVQCAQQYLIPGDLWRSLNPAIRMLTGQNIYFIYPYPLMFGFILAGLSICSGLPVVNTYVQLFPLISLNILSFYALIRVLFGNGKRIAITATIIYSFMGGFGWISQNFIYYGEATNWILRLSTQDVCFTFQFWSDIMFSFKSLALSLVFAFMIAFVISSKIQDAPRKIIMLSFSSLFIVFSFYIHMIDIILVPVVITIAYVYEKDKWRYLSLLFLLFISFTIIYITNALMFNFYTWLTSLKISSSIYESIAEMNVPLNLFLPLLIFSPIILFLGYFGIRYNWQRLIRFSNFKIIIKYFKYIIIVALIVIYLLGLYIWLNSPPPSYTLLTASRLPWYYYTTKYGFVGFLALVGLGFAKWKEKWFTIAAFWCLITLLIGNLWWGSRTINYLFPMLALFAAIGINYVFLKINTFRGITISSINLKYFIKTIKKYIKPVAALSIVLMTILATSSVIYLASYYSARINPSAISDNEVLVFLWIYYNVPVYTTVLVPNIYSINLGVERISDRNTYLSDQLPITTDAVSLSNAVNTLNTYNIRYGITLEGEFERPFLECLIQYSNLAFQSGDIKVYELPVLDSPSPNEYTVAVINNELLDFRGNASYVGWLDDTFETGWTFNNTNTTSDGKVLTLKKQFLSIDGWTNEPSAHRNLDLVVDTNVYPYLVIRYRNTDDTNISVGQILTTWEENNQSGFITNLFLHESEKGDWTFLVKELPPNQKVASISVWMRNYDFLDGRAGLEIDYIAFTSNSSIFEFDLGSIMRFLSVATTALWPTKYAVFPSFDQAVNPSIVVSTYNVNVVDYLQNATDNQKFAFFNTTASIPTWGEDWQSVELGLLGSYNNTQVLIIDTKSVTSSNRSIEGLSELATNIYQIF